LSNVKVGHGLPLTNMDPNSFILVCEQHPRTGSLVIPEAISVPFYHFRKVVDAFQKTICEILTIQKLLQ